MPLLNRRSSATPSSPQIAPSGITTPHGARELRIHVLAIAGYLLAAIVFTWPLPLHLADSLLGPPDSDVGEYIWNLWVFRHEIVAHHSSPLFTSEILSLATPAALTLQNYTPFANVLAFPVLPLLGIVCTFNVLTMLASVLSAYAMFLYARHRTRDACAGWIAGLLFGFSAYIAARQTEHLSLALAAPLPVFGLLLHRVTRQPRLSRAVFSGGVVAWAYLCDPYYAVYCLLMLAFAMAYTALSVESRAPFWGRWPVILVDVAICAAFGLIVAVLVTGGGRFELFGRQVSITELYTPVLVAVLLAGLRYSLLRRLRLRLVRLQLRTAVPLLAGATAAMGFMLAPVLLAFASPNGSPLSVGVPLYWRSSPSGLDLLSYVLPNPYHLLAPAGVARWLSAQPNGLIDSVGAVSWVSLGTILFATARRGFRPARGWVIFTVTFGLLSLGPFIHVAGFNTFIPTPWALLRYAPIIGAARMPGRFAVLASMGVAMLCAMAVHRIRQTSVRPDAVGIGLVVLLAIELLPLSRPLSSAAIPDINRVIAADRRDVRVLNLPFGLRDGVSSRGDQTSSYQFFQTLHEKPLVGGYLSRLPPNAIEHYRQIPLISELLDLSEGLPVDPHRARAALAQTPASRAALNIGWVVIDTQRASNDLVKFASDAFNLTLVESDGRWNLYRVALE
jgi:hypothetical protein